MAQTLADVLKYETKPLVRGFWDIFLRRSKLAEYITTERVSAMKVTDLRQTSLPTPQWVKLNSYPTESLGQVDAIEEAIYRVGGIFDTDDSLVRDKSLRQDPRALQTELWSIAMSYEFNDKIINGAGAGSDQPDGISTRVNALASAQTVNTSSVDISATGSTASTMNAFIDYLDQALMRLGDGDTEGNDVLLLLNEDAMLRFWSTLRRMGLFKVTTDNFGREVRQYKNARLIDPGVKADQTTKIIPTTANLTTIYGAKMGDGFLKMLEFVPLTIKDYGQVVSTWQWRTEIRWEWGLSQPHPRGLVQLTNVKVA